MKWKKLGKVFNFEAIDDALLTHASNPLALHISGNVFRVFFSGRDKDNKSSVGFVDIDIQKLKVIKVCDRSLFKYGGSDCFYSHGVSIGNIYSVNGHKYILFMGWQLRDRAHWRGDIGRIKLEGPGSMILQHEGPFLSIDEEDPVSLSYPWVMKDEGLYKMWYGSTITWEASNGEMVHVIKYATSRDGEQWQKHGLALPYELGVAQAFSRPTVVKDKEGYHMWYSYRSGGGKKYRIGYASSLDGIKWGKEEDSGIDVSESGWDSEMIEYPFVFDHKGQRFMLYNGNDYGKTGFGLAALNKR